MVIDIIHYTDEQYAALSAEKLKEVRTAQIKKDRLTKALTENIRKVKQSLIDRGIFSSSIWEKRKGELNAEYEAEVSVIREALLFYLRYAVNDSEGEVVPEDVPYEVDFSLDEEARLMVVRDYYLSAYSDGAARFAAFQADEFARTYLGELYAPLWHYFQDLA